jgi:hypothetical protein
MLRDAVLMALMMLLCTMPSYSALTEGEIDALGAILESWPTLHDFPLPSGQPWQRNNISHACENHFYGVNCSDGADPHVKSLYVPHEVTANFLPLSFLSMLPMDA